MLIKLKFIKDLWVAKNVSPNRSKYDILGVFSVKKLINELQIWTQISLMLDDVQVTR
jgi:hypothetical protein